MSVDNRHYQLRAMIEDAVILLMSALILLVLLMDAVWQGWNDGHSCFSLAM